MGRGPCTVTSIELDSPRGTFSFPFESQVETPTTLAFRQLRVINVRHAPTATRPDHATLTVVSDDGDHPTQALEIGGLGY